MSDDQVPYVGMPTRGHVKSLWECIFCSPSTFIRLPEDFFLFAGRLSFLSDEIGLVDQGYERKGNYHYWSLWEQENEYWIQPSCNHWSFHESFPHYVMTLFVSEDQEITSPYEDVAMYCMHIWIADKATLEDFFVQFPLSLEVPGKEDREREILTTVFSCGLEANQPSPLDYLHRYWRKVSDEDRLRFLTEMLTPNERRALQTGLEDA